MSSVAEPDFDDVLKEIAKQVPANKVDDLGTALGFKYTESENFVATSRSGASISSDGTLKMLRDWREKKTNPDEKAALRSCLKAADLNRLAVLPILLGGQGQHHQATAFAFQVSAASSASRLNKREVTTKEISELSRMLHDDKYNDLFDALGFNYNYLETVKRRNFMNTTAASKELLHEWKTKTCGYIDELDQALKEADSGGLINKYKT